MLLDDMSFWFILLGIFSFPGCPVLRHSALPTPESRCLCSVNTGRCWEEAHVVGKASFAPGFSIEETAFPRAAPPLATAFLPLQDANYGFPSPHWQYGCVTLAVLQSSTLRVSHLILCSAVAIFKLLVLLNMVPTFSLCTGSAHAIASPASPDLFPLLSTSQGCHTVSSLPRTPPSYFIVPLKTNS